MQKKKINCLFSNLFQGLFKSRSLGLVAVLCAVALAACAPIVATRGNLLSPGKIEQVHPGLSTRGDVEEYWGPPTTVAAFDPNVWYYIGETTEQQGVFEAEVVKRQMIRVTFGAEEVVEQLAVLDPESGQDIAFIDRKTPTAGKEYTAFQQFVGNLGRFNPADTAKK